jgi:methyltransferase (TIGR00027 family)
MARTDDDSWDLATGVGATATMVAAYRAAASKRDHPLISDPFAEPLVHAVGIDVFSRLAAGDLDESEAGEDDVISRMTDVFAVRTRFFDDFFTDAGRAGIRQVVIVASGLDARPYRLSWPAETIVYEIDQPEVIAFKTNALARLGADPTTERRTVGIDLRQDWPTALREAGFDAAQPTAWLAEGLMIGFLPPDAQDRLLDNITALSASASRLAGDYVSSASLPEAAADGMRAVTDRWRHHGLDLDIADLTYSGDRNDVVSYLGAHGWDAVGASTEDLFVANGFSRSNLDTFSWILYARAVRK